MTVTVINSGAAKDTLGTLTEFDITLASLGSSTAGVGRQSALIENTEGEREVRIYVKLKLGTSPTSARAAYVYLLLGNSDLTYTTDGCLDTDAAVTILNAQQIAAIRNKATGAATGDDIWKEVITRIAAPYWGIAIVHDTGVALNSTESNHIAAYQYVSAGG